MSKINRLPVRRTAAGVLASTLVLSGALAAASPASAATGFALERIAGDNRYETSAEIAEVFGATSGAILASGEVGRSVDALSANFLAGVRGVPVLLTQRDRVPASVMARLNALTGAKTITIVGGPVAVSVAVENELRAAGFTVDRLAGDDRYETSEAIIRNGAASASTIGLVASGFSFPDALAGGPLSYKGKHPVFLTAGATIPQDTVDAMVAAGTRQVIILGGTAAVPASVEAQLATRGITVLERLGGAGRSETSRIVADYLIANMGFTNTTFNVASGAPRGEGVDALSGAALSGKQNRTLLITDSVTSAGPVVAFATARARTLNTVGNIFGGPNAVSTGVEEQIEAAGGAAGANQTFTVTPGTAATLNVVRGDTVNVASDDRSYSVATAAAGQPHSIRLVPAANVTVGANGNVTFADADGTAGAGDNMADLGSVDARIINVQGIAGTYGAAANGVVPVAGTITFTVDGEDVESVVPVVFFDADADGNLDLDEANSPVAAEAFGVGGATTWINPAAESRSVPTDTPVTGVAKDANQFDALESTFTYDANDTFRIAGLPATLDEFEAVLSAGDTIDGTYTANSALGSTFDLTDANPPAPDAPAVEVGSGANSNDVTVTATVPAGVDSVQIQRATVTGGAAGAFSTIATEAATDDDAVAAGTQVVYADNNVAAGSYQYRLVFVNDGDTGPASDTTAATTVAPPAADTTAPTVLDAVVSSNGGSAFLLESGDQFTLYLSEVADAPDAGDTFRLTDADGTVVDVAANAGDFVLNTEDVVVGTTTYAPGRVLTVTRENTDAFINSGTQGDLALPVTITAQSGTTDVAGNQLNLIGSADTVINVE